MLVCFWSNHAVIIQDSCNLRISHFFIYEHFKNTHYNRGSFRICYDAVFVQRITHKPVSKVSADIAAFFPVGTVRRPDFFRQVP